MADIKVSTQEIKDAAAAIRGYNQTLTDLLETIYSDAKNLQNNSWTSDAANEFCKKLDAFKSRTFDNYKNYTDDYQKFLDRTAQVYESTEETNINNVTSEIKDSAAGMFTE